MDKLFELMMTRFFLKFCLMSEHLQANQETVAIIIAKQIKRIVFILSGLPTNQAECLERIEILRRDLLKEYPNLREDELNVLLNFPYQCSYDPMEYFQDELSSGTPEEISKKRKFIRLMDKYFWQFWEEVSVDEDMIFFCPMVSLDKMLLGLSMFPVYV